MSQYWSDTVHSLTPYVPGEQPKINNLIKLNTNEHPFGPSPRVLEAIQSVNNDTLRLYPDPNADALKSALARHHGVQANQVFVGNGSDEVLAHAFMALLKHPGSLWFPDITYSFYPVYCGLYGIDTAPSRWPMTSRFAPKTTCHATVKPQAPSSSPTPTHPRAARCRWSMWNASSQATHKPWC